MHDSSTDASFTGVPLLLQQHPSLDFYMLSVQRTDVEAGRVGPYVDTYRQLAATPECVRRFRSRVWLTVSGYGGDPRELWEIPGVRAFMAALHAEVPYTLHFHPKFGEEAFRPLFCLVDAQRTSARSGHVGIAFPPEQLRGILEQQVRGVVSLYTTLECPREEFHRFSTEIATSMVSCFPVEFLAGLPV